MKRTQGRILVIRGGAIGDFVLTLPVFSALREMFPNTRIEALGYTHIVQLAVVGGLVDEAHSIEARALAGFFAKDGDLDEELAAFFGEFQIIVSYLYDPDVLFQTNVLRCTNAQFHVGPHRPKDDGGAHATDIFLKPLERLAIMGADATPRIDVKPWVNNGTGIRLDEDRKWLAAHPGSGSPSKNWPHDRWEELLKRIVAETEFNVLVVGGETEGDRLEELCATLPKDRARLLRSRPLAEVARVLKRCEAFVGHDSGITHLAAAVGLPGVALWGETVEEVWRPRSERIELVRGEAGLDSIAVERVMEAVVGLVGR